MTGKLEITYLHHSGFIVQAGNHALVFDYYRDAAGCLPPLLKAGKEVMVFCSHQHSDHFNQAIASWSDKVSAYVFSADFRARGGVPGIADEKIIYMNPYEAAEHGGVKVRSYGSTDEGVSFFLEVDGWRIFHAGDLNWWHWKNDTIENIKLAKEDFERELNRLTDEKLDVAFFPVDSRLEEYRALGAEAFCRAVDVRQLVAMHTCGKNWQAPEDFPAAGKKVAVWCPEEAGAVLSICKK